MFKRKINPDSTDTLIGEGTVFEGTLKSEAGVRVEGKILGDINCKGDVTIGGKGYARSNLFARNVVIAGTVHGNVTATGKLTILSSGAVTGNIACTAFIIEEGGKFMGASKMDSPETERETPKIRSSEPVSPSGNAAGY